MIECKFSTAVLVDYLEKRQKEPQMPIPPYIASHARDCQACARLLNEEAMARAFIRFFRNLQKSASSPARSFESPSVVAPGQIWRFFFGSDKQSEFCLITSQPFKASETLDLAVRVSPLFLSPNRQELDQSDILVPSGETALAVPVLIETWNERPILCRQLMEYFGELDEQTFEAIRSNAAQKSNISSRVRAFRQHEIARGALYSDMVFTQLHEYDAAPDEVLELETNGIRLIYRSIEKLVQSVLQPTPRLMFSLREDTSFICAASIPPTNKFLDDLHKVLCDFIEQLNTLPFRVRRLSDNSIKIVHTSKKDFSLIVNTIENRTLRVASELGVCHIKPDNPDTLVLKDIATITFEEK